MVAGRISHGQSGHSPFREHGPEPAEPTGILSERGLNRAFTSVGNPWSQLADAIERSAGNPGSQPARSICTGLFEIFYLHIVVIPFRDEILPKARMAV